MSRMKAAIGGAIGIVLLALAGVSWAGGALPAVLSSGDAVVMVPRVIVLLLAVSAVYQWTLRPAYRAAATRPAGAGSAR